MDKKKLGQDHTNIGGSTTIKGDLHFDGGDLRIDGRIEGNIIANGRLVVGESAKISGNLKCKSAEIHGELKGDIHCEDLLTLKATSNVEGGIKVSQFALEQGAILNTNSIDMRGENYIAPSAPKNNEAEEVNI